MVNILIHILIFISTISATTLQELIDVGLKEKCKFLRRIDWSFKPY